MKKIKMVFKNLVVFGFLLTTISCQKEGGKKVVVVSEDYHKAVDKITEVIVHDIFSPPVASRIYNYANIAAYEVMAGESDDLKSLVGQLNGFDKSCDIKTEEFVDFKMAALIAYLDVGKELVFSGYKVEVYQDSLYNSWRQVDEKVFEKSKAYGDKVARCIKEWVNKDNYAETRSMPKFSVNTDDPSRWQSTPPDYMDGIEPHWREIRPSVLVSAEQFKPARYPDFSIEKGTAFYAEILETYKVRNQIVEEGDSSEKLQIAQFWDCNPYVSTHKGHVMFAAKKITPGAHWIGICKIACKAEEADFENTVFAYTKTSIAIADAFISCWDEKYRSNLIRPETLINKYIDEDWEPVLQTPPFPEYTSGHSVVSGAASTVLTDIFGQGFEFNDDTELAYGLPIRSFSSFDQAAEEAAISRLYGGIHYRAAIEIGLEQGRELGRFVVGKLKMKVSSDAISVNREN